MPPLETETALESYERGRFENRVSSQELSSLCSMIKRLMTDRLRQREPRMGAAAAAIAALVRQPVAPRAGAAAAAAAAAASARQPAAVAVAVAPQPVVALQNEPENAAPPQEEPERSSSSSSDGSSSSSSDGSSSSSSSSSPPVPESKPRGAPARSRSRRFNLRIIGVPEAEDKANEAQALLEQLLAENFPELQNHHPGAGLRIAKAHRVPSRFDERKATPRHILVTFLHLSDKERLVRLSRQRKAVTFQGVAVRLASDFSPQVLQARRQWSRVYRALQEKECQPRILYPARLSFVYQGQRKTVLDVPAFEKFVAQVPALGDLLSLSDASLLPVEKESAEE